MMPLTGPCERRVSRRLRSGLEGEISKARPRFLDVDMDDRQNEVGIDGSKNLLCLNWWFFHSTSS